MIYAGSALFPVRCTVLSGWETETGEPKLVKEHKIGGLRAMGHMSRGFPGNVFSMIACSQFLSMKSIQ